MSTLAARWRRVLFSLLVLALGAALSGCAGVPRPAANWWTYQADFLRTGSVAQELPPPLELAWNVPNDLAESGGQESAPVFGSRKVFLSLGLNPGVTRALDLATGQVLWSFQIAEPRRFTQRGSLVVANGRVYGVFNETLGTAGRALALREDNGNPVWSRELSSLAFMESPLLLYDSMVVVSNPFGVPRMSLLSVGSGAMQWSIEIDDDVWMWGAPAVNVATILVSGERALHAVRMTGQRAWRFLYAEPLIGTHVLALPRPSVQDRAVAVAAGVKRNDAAPPHDDEVLVYAIDAQTGLSLWRRTRQVDFTGNSLYAVARQDRIIVLAGTHAWALRASDGGTLWEKRVPIRLQFAPALAGNVLYFTDGVTLYAWDAATGAELWSLPLPVPADRPLWRGAVAIDQGYLVIGHAGGMLAFRRPPP